MVENPDACVRYFLVKPSDVAIYVEHGAADIGIAGGDGCAVLFRKGEIVRKIPEDQIIETLLTEIKRMTE